MYRIGARALTAGATTARVVATLVGAIVLGLAIPVFWLWLGGALQGSAGGRAFNPIVLVIVLGGMLTSYLIVAHVATRLGAGRSGPPSAPQHSWNRSMRDQPHAGESPLSPLEKLFAGAAIVVSVAYAVWWVTSAGSGLPPPGGP